MQFSLPGTLPLWVSCEGVVAKGDEVGLSLYIFEHLQFEHTLGTNVVFYRGGKSSSTQRFRSCFRFFLTSLPHLSDGPIVSSRIDPPVMHFWKLHCAMPPKNA